MVVVGAELAVVSGENLAFGTEIAVVGRENVAVTEKIQLLIEKMQL